MTDEIEKLKQEFNQEIDQVSDIKDLDDTEIKYLGRKSGKLTNILRGLKDLPQDQHKQVGLLANQLKQEIEAKIQEAKRFLSGKLNQGEYLDVTLPGAKLPEGHLHLVTQAIRDITHIFERIGFTRVKYPEVEWDYYAFESLNMPADHPARDEWETFFIDSEPVGPKGRRVLTPHTSSGQVREMEKGKLPIRMINISKCYRREASISHLAMFHQFEGLLVDENVTIASLKGTLEYFFKNYYGQDKQYRLRPFHFRFTEPSFEIDVSCDLCKGKGCKMCKAGWLELGGAGMVHPNVLKAGKIDPNEYSGFAFGWGVERVFLMKPGLNIPDIRMLYNNDLRFLNQF